MLSDYSFLIRGYTAQTNPFGRSVFLYTTKHTRTHTRARTRTHIQNTYTLPLLENNCSRESLAIAMLLIIVTLLLLILIFSYWWLFICFCLGRHHHQRQTRMGHPGLASKREIASNPLLRLIATWLNWLVSCFQMQLPVVGKFSSVFCYFFCINCYIMTF